MTFAYSLDNNDVAVPSQALVDVPDEGEERLCDHVHGA